VNARDAMPGGGELVFETCAAELDEEYCRDHVGASPGRYLMISVTDTGAGIPNEIVDRIFEPYFTTKEEGKGTGMGLAMVYGIICNHGGAIRVYSEVGHGTTFKVYLPVAAAPEPQLQEARHETPVPGTGRILIVEDEDVIRSMATRMLEHLGYDVVTASDGQEGVEYYKEHGSEIDLIIIDMIMPRMNGRECFLRIRAMNPTAKAILSTGYGLDSTVRELLSDGMIGYVQKPYVVGQLSEAVAKALNA
jgi:CheY-like chemotaxis protein